VTVPDVSKEGVAGQWNGSILRRPSTSFVVIFNLVAVAALGLIIGAMKWAGSMALVVIPFWVVFVLCGFPWSNFDALNGIAGDQSAWSATNVYFEIMVIRGSFINATLLGICLDALKRARERANPSAPPVQSSSTRRLGQTVLKAVILLVVFGMLIVPQTPYGRRVRLHTAWTRAASTPLFYVKRHDNGPLFAKSGFRVAVQNLLGDPRTSHKGRRDLTALALAIEKAIAVDTGDSDAVEGAERDLSAALLCVTTSSRKNYVGGFPIQDMLAAELDAQERGTAFHNFIERVGGKYTLPSGDGCKS
jgi:hypothetical protein